MRQLNIFEIHNRESNPESESYLKANKSRLSNNCQTLFNALLSGDRLTCTEMLTKLGIGDGRRRICDLRENGVRLSFETTGQVKTWYFSEEDKEYNRGLLKTLCGQKSLELKK